MDKEQVLNVMREYADGLSTEANITDAIQECLAARAEMGLPPTVAMREIEVSI